MTSSSSAKPAILGGTPVRTKPFTVGPMVDGEEERLVVEAIREHNFSRYIGASSPDIEEILRLPSKDAAAIRADWHFLGGENVRAFAAAFAEYFGVRYAIPVNAATSGLSVSLAAAGVGPGDEVIVPAISFSATASSILLFGSIPVFVDVDPRTFCLNPVAVEAAITERTRAILPVHLLGNACDMDRILAIAKQRGLKVIEDCAQAPGVKYRGKFVGSLGDAGVFSFQQSKNIMTGEGGMITTSDPEIARKARLILNHGETVLEDHHTVDEIANVIGCNFRMTELVAAVGRAQLPKLKAVNEWRTANFRFLAEALRDVPFIAPPYVPAEVEYVCHAAAFLYDAKHAGCPRDVFVAAVRAEGVPIGTGYVRAMYEAPTFLKRIALGKDGWPWTAGKVPSPVTYSRGQCPVAESLLAEKFLWIYHVAHPSTKEDMMDVASAIHKVAANIDAIAARAGEIQGTKLAARSQGRIL
jgi:perosamine synthetase